MTFPLPLMDPCYLCGIVADATSWNIVERTDLTITVLNGRQFETGQCMVVSLRHAPTLLDLRAATGDLDHRISHGVTDAKIQTAALLRKYFR